MAKTRDQFIDYTAQLVKDKAPIYTAAEQAKFLEQAVDEHDGRRPLYVVEVITGDGNAYLALPSDWETDYSWIDFIEYPLDNQPQTYLKDNEFYVAPVPAAIQTNGYQLMFPTSNHPGNGLTGHMRYSRKHRMEQKYTDTASSGTTTTLTKTSAGWTADVYIGMVVGITGGTGDGQVAVITDNDTDTLTFAAMTTAPDNTSVFEIVDTTIPDKEFKAVCNLAASIYCGALAAYYAQTKQNVIRTDAANFESKSAQEAAKATAYRTAYDMICRPRRASAIGNLDSRMQGGQARLVHRRNRR